MNDNARHAEDSGGPESSRSTPSNPAGDPFSLEAYLERQHAEFADGPTMAEILADMDRFRSGGVPRELIAATVREDRTERAG